MSRIEEIEAAIDSLPPSDYLKFVEWFRQREEDRWDCQIDADSASGNLDALFSEAESEKSLRDWPRQK